MEVTHKQSRLTYVKTFDIFLIIETKGNGVQIHDTQSLYTQDKSKLNCCGAGFFSKRNRHLNVFIFNIYFSYIIILFYLQFTVIYNHFTKSVYVKLMYCYDNLFLFVLMFI